MKSYHTRRRTSSLLVKPYSPADLALVEHLLSEGLLDIEDGKLMQHRLVLANRVHEGRNPRPHPTLPGVFIIDEPFRPESWEGYPLEG